ncbi:hypothetical protein DIPPA_17474 [Diplonema papillatum]|nr:hypothetical protein DIPPA_17474 [Diplonema papillatum]
MADVMKRLLVPPSKSSRVAACCDFGVGPRGRRRDVGARQRPLPGPPRRRTPPALPLPMEEDAPLSKSSLAACYNIIRSTASRRWGETKKQAHTYSKCARREGRDDESSPDVKKRLLVPPPAATSAWAREADAEMWERVSARYPDRRDAGRTPTPPPALPLPKEEYAPSSKSSLAACYGFGTNIIRRWGETKKQAHTYSKCARREGRDGESSPDVKKRLLVPPPAATSAWAREADAEMWERVSARYPDRRDAARRRPSRCRWKRTRRCRSQAWPPATASEPTS